MPNKTPGFKFETPTGLISGGKSGCGAKSLNVASHFEIGVKPKYVIKTTSINNTVQPQSLSDIFLRRNRFENSERFNLLPSSL